jgi:hypothetical protein
MAATFMLFNQFTFEFKRGSKRARKAMPPAEARIGKENWGEVRRI